jgi:3-polyprenyl-4-hydroxybenzoate decarboxylase
MNRALDVTHGQTIDMHPPAHAEILVEGRLLSA